MDIQMNLLDIVISAASQFWYFPFFIIIAIVFKSSWLKGVLGEFIVNRILSSLPSGEYTLIKNVLLSDVELSDYIKRIEEIKLAPGLVTDYMHKKHVKELVSAKENYAGDVCPKCGSALILRESRRGKNVGSKFWGCSQYPKCKTVIKSN